MSVMQVRCFVIWSCLLRCVAAGPAPLVDVSLATADAPAELTNAIAARDAAREALESASSASDVRAFNAALRAAGPQIDMLAKDLVDSFWVHRSIGFLSRDARVVDVHVADVAALDVAAFLPRLQELDGEASVQEAAEFNARLADFTALTAFLLREAQAASKTMLAAVRGIGSSFVAERASGSGINAFADMESRRDIGEQHFRARHLSLALALLQRENAMLERALRRELGVSRGVGSSFLGGAAGADGRYTFELVPPAEDEQDVAIALDDLLSSERAKQHSSNTLFAENKQRILDGESADIRRAIAAASP